MAADNTPHRLYFRLDLEGHDGQLVSVFAEADPQTGGITQQFGLSMDAGVEDFEHCRLTTIADVTGTPLTRIDVGIGWRRITPDVYEVAVETKRRIWARDEREARKVWQPCGKCAGEGKLASTRRECDDCDGRGRVRGVVEEADRVLVRHA